MINLDNISQDIDRRQYASEDVDYLLLRMELLEPSDRMLLEMHIKHDISFRNLSILSGLREITVARRVQNIRARLLGKEFISIYRNKEKFDKKELMVAYDYYLLGLGYRAIASKRRISKFAVRKMIRKLKEWLENHDSVGKRKRHI